MATIKLRGNSYSLIYYYSNKANNREQQWETYYSELEAMTRKAQVEHFAKNKDNEGLFEAAMNYQKNLIELKMLHIQKHY